MPIFSYIAVDGSGQTLRGQLEAPSENALETLLKDRGQWLAEVSAQKAVKVRTRTAGGRIPRRMLVEFFMQLGIQLKAGIPILTALGFGATECPHAKFRMVQQEMLDRVEGGEMFSQALAGYPKIFPPLVINLTRAGEASGRLPETCKELHRYYEWLDRMVSDVRQALVYPIFVLMCTVGFVLLLFTFLIPRFASMLSELKVPLPMLTKVVMGISDFFVAYWLVIGGGVAFLVVALKVAVKRSNGFALFLDRVKLGLPVYGPLLRLICLSRFAHNLAVLYRSGVALLESLHLCKGLVGNRVIEKAVADIVVGVNEGVPMNEVMSKQGVFSKLILQMVKVGEGTGSLGESLQNVADYYNEIIPRQVKRLFTIMEPVMILVLIGIVGTVALAIFLPIASLLTGG